jgi:hypothetical protein
MHDRNISRKEQISLTRSKSVAMLGLIFGWTWAIVAGGGGLWLLWTKGPWPLTNGWFALASGISGWPVTGWILKKAVGISMSRWVQFGLAALFFVAGRIALRIGI